MTRTDSVWSTEKVECEVDKGGNGVLEYVGPSEIDEGR